MSLFEGSVAIADEPICETPPRAASLVEPWLNTHLLHPSTVVPVLRARLVPGTYRLSGKVLAL